MRLPQIPLLALLALSACGGPSYGAYRDAVKEELRDPDSAIFKDEQVRTLWSNDGPRLTVSFAKVTANNIMGGKTGFNTYTRINEPVPTKPRTPQLTQIVWTQWKDRNTVTRG